jgi:hypothetical protein
VHNVGDLQSYGRLQSVFFHWIWASGFRKGERVDNNFAEALLRSSTFDQTKLEAIFKLEPMPMHSQSLDIQTTLGNNKVLEYGSFVDKDYLT